MARGKKAPDGLTDPGDITPEKVSASQQNHLGSRRWFLYKADNGSYYSVELDESNAQQCDFTNFVRGAEGYAGLLPGRFKMRYVNATHPRNSAIKRRFWVGTPELFNLIKNQDTKGTITTLDPIGEKDARVTWKLSGPRGESQAIPTVIDTGATDTDVIDDGQDKDGPAFGMPKSNDPVDEA